MTTHDLSTGRIWGIASNVLIFLSGLILIASAASKFAHVPRVVTELSGLGFAGNRLLFIATLEVFSALLFLLPASRSIGLLLVSSFMGGAIAAHLGHGRSILQPGLVLALIWLGAWLRHPEILWSLHRKAHAATQVAARQMRKDAQHEESIFGRV